MTRITLRGGGASGSQDFRLALYRDNNGAPGAKVFESIGSGFSSGLPARWYCTDAALYPVTAGQYWIAIHTGGTAGVIRDYGDGAASGTLIDFPGVYVIAIQTSDPAGVIRDYGDTRTNPDGDWNSIPDAFEDGALPSMDAVSPLPGSSTLSVYASYTKPF